ncbi:type II secretion system protein GspL [Crateriforma conspicua]|uniref:type II secretion system protein GspL n=1 Tax=Crateriforma conspicua TaxID=2527996 RepID=UPI00118BA237|nr:type II secretion system protein GspL [Crateriforma conspicua]QDV61729.1 hypothetical protein Mal65_08560 [Crateriforma conspicua]
MMLVRFLDQAVEVVTQEGSTRWCAAEGNEFATAIHDAPWPDELRNQDGQTIRQWIAQRTEGRSESAAVTIGSMDCYLLSADMLATDAGSSYEQLKFACEDVLPIDAEQIEVAQSTTATHRTLVAIDTSRAEPLVDLLEQNGIPVMTVTPDSMLVLQQIIACRPVPKSCHLIMPSPSFSGGLTGELFTLKSGRPVQWRLLPSGDHPWIESLPDTLADDDSALPVVQLHAPEGTASLPAIPGATQLQFDVSGVLNDAMLQIRSHRPWFDLRRGVLARHDRLRNVRFPLRCFALSTLIALALIAASVWFKTSQLQQQSDVAYQAMRQEFKRTFPGQRVPEAIVKRMRSEQRRALGQRADVSQVEIPTSAMPILLRLLESMPDGVSFAIESLRIRESEFVADLRLDDYADATAIADAWVSEGFRIQPPSSARITRQQVRTRFEGNFAP